MSDSYSDNSNPSNPPDYHDDEAGVIEIPFQSLTADTLAGIIEEFASRDGTDYGEVEYSLADKVNQIEGQLRNGHLTLLFDPVSQSCHIVNSRDWKN